MLPLFRLRHCVCFLIICITDESGGVNNAKALTCANYYGTPYGTIPQKITCFNKHNITCPARTFCEQRGDSSVTLSAGYIVPFLLVTLSQVGDVSVPSFR